MKLILFLAATLFSCGSLAADLSPGDRVALVKDTPLYFSTATVVRTGQSGEQFTVIAARPAEHRVFLSARDALGKEIALNVSDAAVVLVKKGVMAPGTRDGMEVMGEVRKDLAKALEVPAIMAARMSGAARAKSAMENPWRERSEGAVAKGLEWLTKSQNADGSWGPSYQAAMTGFALLAFLGHGETPGSAEYGATVQKGIDWLIENGSKHDGRLNMRDQFDQPGVYEHAIATYALAEYYTMTKDGRVVDLLKNAVGYILQGQGPDGGWMYAYDKSESDTSVSCWQIQALIAAHLSGLNIDGVVSALDKAMLNLKRVQAEDGSFGYRKPQPGSYSLTGAGVFCTYLWKQDKDKSVREGIASLIKETEKKKGHPIEYKHETADLYAWYYNTQACFQVGGGAWQKWSSHYQLELVRNQSLDGSWPHTAGKSPGGELQRDPDGAGPCYRTCLCILMLEVYYRYLPNMK